MRGTFSSRMTQTAQSAEAREMEAMARRAWLERGIAILWPDRIRDDWDRHHVINIASNLYGGKAVRP